MTNEQYYDLIVPYQDALNLLKARLDVLNHSMYGNKSHPIHNIQFRIKQKASIEEKLKRMEAKKIPENIDYAAINGLATEAKQKLQKIQPETIAQASRISGVNPADLSILMVYIEQGKIAKVSEPA